MARSFANWFDVFLVLAGLADIYIIVAGSNVWMICGVHRKDGKAWWDQARNMVVSDGDRI